MLTRLRTLLSWAIIPALVLMQFFDLRRALVGPLWIWSTFLIGFTLATLVCLPLLSGQWHQLSKPGRVMVGAFAATLGYALVSALVTARPYSTGRTTPAAVPPDTWAAVPQIFRTVPLVTAAVTMTAALALVWVIPAQHRLSRLWWAAWTIVVTSLIAWPREIVVHHSTRLATGMGGSATIHLVLLLSVGLFVGAAWQGHRRRASLVGAGLSVVVLLLTGSRAGVLSLVVLAGLIALWWMGRISAKLVASLVVAGVVLIGAVLVVAPQSRRFLNLNDELRSSNLETAGRVLSIGWRQVVFGAGSGRVWPWYAYDARYFVTPWRGLASSPFGTLLTNPHSVLLGVGVELGLLGSLLFLLAMSVPVVLLVREWTTWRAAPATSTPGGNGARTGILLAVVAGFVAFVFDYYLFKNFAVSFWWWTLVSFCLLAGAPAGRRRPAEPERSTSAGRVPE